LELEATAIDFGGAGANSATVSLELEAAGVDVGGAAALFGTNSATETLPNEAAVPVELLELLFVKNSETETAPVVLRAFFGENSAMRTLLAPS
jgi:hypothetical protein